MFSYKTQSLTFCWTLRYSTYYQWCNTPTELNQLIQLHQLKQPGLNSMNAEISISFCNLNFRRCHPSMPPRHIYPQDAIARTAFKAIAKLANTTFTAFIKSFSGGRTLWPNAHETITCTETSSIQVLGSGHNTIVPSRNNIMIIIGQTVCCWTAEKCILHSKFHNRLHAREMLCWHCQLLGKQLLKMKCLCVTHAQLQIHAMCANRPDHRPQCANRTDIKSLCRHKHVQRLVGRASDVHISGHSGAPWPIARISDQ